MTSIFDYTNWARSFALKHPRTNFMAIQINFWVVAFLILTLLIHFVSHGISRAIAVPPPVPFLPSLTILGIGGVFYGVVLGISDQWMDKHLRGKSLGAVILSQAGTYFLVLIGMMTITCFVVWDYLILPFFSMGYYSAISIVDWYSEKERDSLGGGRLLIYPYYTGLGVSYQL